MGNGHYALVTHETLALRYPKHLAYLRLKVGPSYAEIASEWAFTVIEVQNAEGFQMWTDNLLDLVSLALGYHEEGERKALEAVWLAMVEMGLKDPHPGLGEAMAAMET